MLLVETSACSEVSWDPPRFSNTQHTANHEMGAQSDVYIQQHPSVDGMDATVTQYVNADLLDTERLTPIQQELELRRLPTGVKPREHDSMTIATKSTLSVEWTSPDSSFGAAFPCCGFIPKKTRRIIEFCLIAIGSFLFIYILIKFSVIITSGLHKNGQNSTNTTSGGSKYLETDDDFYVTSENDDNFFYWR